MKPSTLLILGLGCFVIAAAADLLPDYARSICMMGGYILSDLVRWWKGREA